MSREPFCEEFVASLLVLRAWTAPRDPDFEWRKWVHPGDDARSSQENAEVILARNHACTPVAAWHIAPEFHGINNGESGV